MKKILLLGCGSIGKRYLSILHKQYELIVYDIDYNKLQKLNKKFNFIKIKNLNNLIKYDIYASIIATPNNFHFEHLKKIIPLQKKILVEKPICCKINEYNQLQKMLKVYKTQIYGVCNLRWHPALKIIKNQIKKINKIYFVKSSFGNYLPFMRKNVDVKNIYVSSKKYGGVVFDCIHEIDYLIWLFGRVQSHNSIIKKLTNLKINSEDFASINLLHKNKIVSNIQLDFIKKIKERRLEIYGDNFSIIWTSIDKNPEKIKIFKINKFKKNIKIFDKKYLNIDSMYSEMLRDFLSNNKSKKEKFIKFKDFRHILEIILNIKEGVNGIS